MMMQTIKGNYLLVFVFALAPRLNARAQTGPAGVGNASSNFLWLKADAGTSTTTDGAAISAWNDQSGNGNNVSQSTAVFRPLFESGIAGIMNGMPLVEFDNDATNYDYLSVNDNTTLDNFAGFTSFGVFRLRNGAPSGTPRALYSKRVDPSTSYCYSMFHYSSNKMNFDINSSGAGRMASTSAYAPLTDYIVGGSFDPSLSSNEQKIFTGASTNNGQQSNSGTGISNQPSNLHIGVLYGHTGTSKQFDGYIGEIIMYNRIVNDAEMIIVNNYLSSKYNIAVASNDFYQGDTPGNGEYDFNVAGIGQAAAGHTQTVFSPSVSLGMGLTYVSGFNDGDYVFAGQKLAANANISTDLTVVSGGPLDKRWERIWYIDVTNTSAAVVANVVFDLSDGGFPGLTAGPASNYKLLYRSGSSGPWTIVATASSVAGDQVTFGSYSFASNSNDGYYTIGTLNNSLSPLPIELLSFDAVLNGQQVDLSWETAAETNNAYFTVERSAGATDWEEVLRVNGAGTTNQYLHYAGVDPDPLTGRSYYRLKQTDTDGSHSYSETKVVQNNNIYQEVDVFPNPSDGVQLSLVLTGFVNRQVSVTVTDVLGRTCFSAGLQPLVDRQVCPLATGKRLVPGTYVVQVTAGGHMISKKLVVQQ